MKRKNLTLFAVFMCITAMSFGKSVSTRYRNALVYAYSTVNSVYEDDNIKLEIYDEQLWATNKTKKTIFIDLSRCFLVHNGVSRPIFVDEASIKKSKKKSKKDKGETASISGYATSIDQFITLAPAAEKETHIYVMTGPMFGNYTTSETPWGDFSEYDKRLRNIIAELTEESLAGDPKGKRYLGTAHRHLTEDESIDNLGVSLAYAFDKKPEEWKVISLSTWVSDVYLTPYYVEKPKNLKKKEKRGFGVKETKPAIVHLKADSPYEFEEDEAPMIVCDWQGNFKKGTFELHTTRILYKKFKKPSYGFLGVLGLMLNTIEYGTPWAPLEEHFYKSIINFDGSKCDWGKLKYVSKRKKHAGNKDL